MVLGRPPTISVGGRKARVPAAEVLRAPEWPCPGRAPGGAPSGPKITRNGPRCLCVGPQKVPLSKLMDKINLGTVWVAFWPCLDPCGPKTVSVGPKTGSFGPRVCPAGWNRKWPYLGLDGPNRKHCSHVHIPTLGGFYPSEWPKRTATSSFCPLGARLAAFWGILACACPPKRGQKWVQNDSLPK